MALPLPVVCLTRNQVLHLLGDEHEWYHACNAACARTISKLKSGVYMQLDMALALAAGATPGSPAVTVYRGFRVPDHENPGMGGFALVQPSRADIALNHAYHDEPGLFYYYAVVDIPAEFVPHLERMRRVYRARAGIYEVAGVTVNVSLLFAVALALFAGFRAVGAFTRN